MTSTHNARLSRHRPTTLMLLITAALVAASCGDDDDAAEPTDSATASASPTVTTSPDTSATSAETTATSAGTTAAVTTEGTTELESTTSEPTPTTVPSPVRPEDAGIVVNSPTCVYRAGEILAVIENEDQRTRLESIVGEGAESVPVAPESELAAGLEIVPIEGDPLEVAQQLVEPEDGQVVVEASPNYLFAFAPGWKYAPFDTPTRHGQQVGDDLDGDTEASIAVLDTGFMAGSQSPSAMVTAVITPAVPDPHATAAREELTDGVAAGHGTFIVNMLSQLLPAATITPAAIGARWDHDDHVDLPTPEGQPANVRDDSSVTAALVALDAAGTFDYLNLSFGTYGCTEMLEEPFGDVDAEAMAELLPTIPTYLVPLGLRTVLENWGGGGAQVFAASGNDANRPDHPEVFFPAAWARLYDWLYSVASDPIEFDDDATDDDDYSNRGAWVEHQAKGTRVVSRLPAIAQWGDAEDWYAWSGTSFATPCALAAHAAGMPLESASLDENGTYTDCQINAEAP